MCTTPSGEVPDSVPIETTTAREEASSNGVLRPPRLRSVPKSPPQTSTSPPVIPRRANQSAAQVAAFELSARTGVVSGLTVCRSRSWGPLEVTVEISAP
jgi:hypothetical protein